MFLTLSCDSYGMVLDDGTPADPHYDYPAGRPGRAPLRGAVRPADPEPAPVPRLRPAVLRRLEPQRRLAPHVHVAFRGAVSRDDLRQVIAATYHQVWWWPTDVARFDGDRLPVWHEAGR